MLIEETCIELGLECDDDVALEEAGGIISWIARIYTGKDRDLPGEIEKELETIKTEEHRKKLLEEIDEFIGQAKSDNVSNGGVKPPPDLDMTKFAMPGSDLYKRRVAWFKAEGHRKWRAAAKGWANFITMIYARDGTISKYIAELQRVRAKVAAHKLPKE